MPPTPPTSPPTQTPHASVAARLTVLLGDEHESGQAWHRTARGLLGAQGVETLVARSGRDALALIEESARGNGPRIHVAVLDQRMPVMGGLQILRRLQQDLTDPALPQGSGTLPPAILLADASGARGLTSALMHEALTARVFSVLPKPIELDLLLDTLARAVRRYYQNKWPEGRSGE